MYNGGLTVCGSAAIGPHLFGFLVLLLIGARGVCITGEGLIYEEGFSEHTNRITDQPLTKSDASDTA